MYWYVYFNLFQDLILRLWPWNQYLHLWSTTFNQFCPRLLSTMDCLWLDTCKQSSIALSQALSFFLYFFFFPPTGCLLCRCAVGGNWSLKSEIGCWSSSYSFNRLFALLPSFLGVLLRLSPPCSARDWQLYGSDSWQTKHVANGRTRQAHAEQMQMALGSVVSLFFSLSLRRALCLAVSAALTGRKMYNLISKKYSCRVRGDMVWHPFDRTAKLCSHQHNKKPSRTKPGPDEGDLAI